MFLSNTLEQNFFWGSLRSLVQWLLEEKGFDSRYQRSGTKPRTEIHCSVKYSVHLAAGVLFDFFLFPVVDVDLTL